MEASNSKIESEQEVKSFLSKLKYAIENDDKTDFKIDRTVDIGRDVKYTNRYTMNKLFPDENPNDVMRAELKTLKVENYLRSVKDTRYPSKDMFREFGKVYEGYGEVYIKIRVELLSKENNGHHFVFVMSFHFAEKAFANEVFPYKN